MKTVNGISARYVRSNEAYDIYLITGKGKPYYVNYNRGSGMTEQQIAELESA